MITNWRQVALQEVLAVWFKTADAGAASPRLSPEQYRAAIEPYLLFLRFLPHCDWYRVRLNTVEDLRSLRLIAEESWEHPKDGGQRSVGDGCRTGCVPVAHEQKARVLAERADVRSLLDGQIILFGHGPEDSLSILDGNHRALAYALNLQSKAQEWSPIDAYVGISLAPCRWHGDAVSWIERPPREAGERRYILNIW